ncbi:MAG: hemerythrin domain-containing protein [Rhizobiaceae bacterium]|nr:hemerythrin domain-containing protein [Rhizobiaceae bacterium]
MEPEPNTNFDVRSEDMPEAMRVLFAQYPRDEWEAHPGFKDKTRQWLNAHRGFRQLTEILNADAKELLDRNLDAAEYAARLSRYGNILVGNLHGHHAWEDHEYFPELSAADSRFDRGLEILEKDHAALDTVLHAFTNIGNRALRLETLDGKKLYEEVGNLQPVIEAIEKFLDRHLGDEEELAVPIILHHRLRG